MQDPTNPEQPPRPDPNRPPFASAPSWSNPPPGGQTFHAPPAPFPDTKVRAPAIAMMVVAGFGALGTLMSLVGNALGDFDQQMSEAFRQFRIDRSAQDFVREHSGALRGSAIAWDVVGLVLCAFVAIAAIRMFQGRGWLMALIASLVLFIPCTGMCCCSCFASPVLGVWVLMILLDENVKRRFR